jgi:hypothetical protein
MEEASAEPISFSKYQDDERALSKSRLTVRERQQLHKLHRLRRRLYRYAKYGLSRTDRRVRSLLNSASILEIALGFDSEEGVP